jgi:hypothetical protein
MTLSAASRIGDWAKDEMQRGSRRRWIVVAAVVLVALVVVASVVVLERSGSPRDAVVPQGVRQIKVRNAFPHARPAASYSITDPAKVDRITGLLNAVDARRTTYDAGYGLGVAGIAHNQMCPLIAGPTTTLELQGASGAVLASASFVTGDGVGGLSAGCNPLWFGRGQAGVPNSRFFHPQLALTAHNSQRSNFARQLEQAIGRPLCQRAVGASAQFCKP